MEFMTVCDICFNNMYQRSLIEFYRLHLTFQILGRYVFLIFIPASTRAIDCLTTEKFYDLKIMALVKLDIGF